MSIVLIRGGGDLASGVALRLYRAGLRVVIAEIAQPLAVRRKVAFAEAINSGEIVVEGVTARNVKDSTDLLGILQVLAKGIIPVLVDPDARSIALLHPLVLVDGRMVKQKVPLIPERVELIVGLGPGFIAGENCNAVVETNRGHMLGRVLWAGAAQANTGVPEGIGDQREARVLRAPTEGLVQPLSEIGDHLSEGQAVANVNDIVIRAPFAGVLRGLLPMGFHVTPGMKIGDVDPRNDPRYCFMVSDKSLAIGGGVMEAILSKPELRKRLWA